MQWALVGVYILAMFLVAGQETSSFSYTSRFFARWLPHLSGSELRQFVLIARKTGHVLAYGLLTLLVYYAARKTKKIKRGALPFATFFALAIAVADERYQSYLHHRTGAFGDVLIDGIGIGLVAIVLWLVARNKGNKEVVEENVEN